MLRPILVLAIVTGCWGAGVWAAADDFKQADEIRFEGRPAEPEQYSGATLHRNLLVVVPDEGAEFNVFKPVGADRFQLLFMPQLLTDNSELDMEAVASDGKRLYVLGSNSLVRKRIEESNSYIKNKQRLRDVGEQGGRHLLWRLDVSSQGRVTDFEFFDLSLLLAQDRILERFVNIPGKENGIDLEGLAVSGNQLYIGCRGPVLRDNYVPIIVVEFGRQSYDLRFVRMGGRGVRDIARVDDGFLILAGAVGDGDANFPIYWWDGRDCLPGIGSPGGRTDKLGDVDEKKGEKPEGLAILETTPEHWKVLIVSDGGAQPQHLIVPRP